MLSHCTFKLILVVLLIFGMSMPAHAGISDAEIDVLFTKLDTPERTSALKKLLELGENGDSYVQYGLAMYYGLTIYDTEKQMTWLRRAANNGHVKAQDAFIQICLEHKLEKGIKWAREDAEKHKYWAESMLAHVYAEGKGVKRDYAEAVKWNQKILYTHPEVEETGWINISAHNDLGDIYHKGGDGIPKDLVQAYVHYGVVLALDKNPDSEVHKHAAFQTKLLNWQLSAQEIERAKRMIAEELKKP